MTTSEPIKLLELRVTERKCAKQAEMIRSALAELGCEEAPSGCPDLSAETVGVDSLDGSSPDHQVSRLEDEEEMQQRDFSNERLQIVCMSIGGLHTVIRTE